MLKHLHNFFIPHEGNDHKPHALRPRALKWYAAILAGIKIITTVFLFTAYPDPAMLSAEMRDEVIGFINASRTAAGLPPLTVHVELDRAAQAKATDMLHNGYFDHVTPDGQMPWDFINKSLYNYRAAGENLAIDFSSARVAHNALMESSTHRANILNKNFTNIGIGMVSGTFEGHETNILVEFFGSPAPAKTSPQIVKTAQAATIESSSDAPPTPAQKPQTQQVPAPTPKTTPAPEQITAPIAKSEIKQPITTTSVISKAEPQQQPKTRPAIEQQTATPTITVSDLPAESQILAASTKARSTKVDFAILLSQWTRRILYATLMYLLLTLLVNIFVRIRIQHASVIGQTVALMIVVMTLAATNWHFIDRLTTTVKIL